MTPPNDASFSGGLLGGFLLENNNSVQGQIVYSISVPTSGLPVPCSGSATVSGTVSGQNVSLTAIAGTQTITLTGMLGGDGKSMSGTYTALAVPNCGGSSPEQNPWTASLIPSVSGSVQGSIYSTQMSNDFAVSGSLSQGPNTGTSNSTVIGTLTFQQYPCTQTVSVNGQISGSSVILQLIDLDGLTDGQIGSATGSQSSPTNDQGQVTVQSSGAGFVLQGQSGYGITTKTCPTPGSAPGDHGNICLALGSTAACQQPVLLSPAQVVFGEQPLGSQAASKTITVTNTAGVTLSGLTLSPTGNNFPRGDFTGLPSFSESDNCSTSPGAAFSLTPQQSCTATISFSPQQSCPWLPAISGGAPASICPPFLTQQLTSPPAVAAALTLNCPDCPNSNGVNTTFNVTVLGLGISSIQPSAPELDFGAEDASLNEAAPAQTVAFTNHTNSAIQILPALAGICPSPLPRPAVEGSVAGTQVVASIPAPSLVGNTITYACDVDTISGKANFQIVPGSDTCSGTLLGAQQSCSISIVYAPQPNEANGGLDYFLQLNTLQCTGGTNTNCEIDSGRLPVELKSGTAGPLRVTPAAGLDFGTWPLGQSSFSYVTLTLANDPNVANPQPILFNAQLLNGDFSEINNTCPVSLAPGSNCTITLSFTPKISGFDQGSIKITYDNTLSQTIVLRGFGQ